MSDAGGSVLHCERPRWHDERVNDDAERISFDLDLVHRRFGAWIRASLRRRLAAGGDDAYQQVLLKLSPALARRDARSAAELRALIARTVRSVAIDALRAKRAVAADSATVERAPDSTDESERRKVGEETRLMLRRLGVLSERERSVLRLRFVDGLTFREIAAVLGVPQGSVAGWYSRALDRLRGKDEQ